MSIDFTKPPYLDRFDPEDDRTRVLFQPDRVLQSAELNEQQSIMHHYLEQIGSSIFVDGNIQSGMGYTIKDGKLKVLDGQVYLAGKVRKFREQEVPFVGTGRFEVGIKLEQRVVTSDEDPTLLDQTEGAVSYYSKGADRLVETILLVANDPEAPTLYTFEDGDLFTKVEVPAQQPA